MQKFIAGSYLESLIEKYKKNVQYMLKHNSLPRVWVKY